MPGEQPAPHPRVRLAPNAPPCPLRGAAAPSPTAGPDGAELPVFARSLFNILFFATLLLISWVSTRVSKALGNPGDGLGGSPVRWTTGGAEPLSAPAVGCSPRRCAWCQTGAFVPRVGIEAPRSLPLAGSRARSRCTSSRRGSTCSGWTAPRPLGNGSSPSPRWEPGRWGRRGGWGLRADGPPCPLPSPSSPPMWRSC